MTAPAGRRYEWLNHETWMSLERQRREISGSLMPEVGGATTASTASRDAGDHVTLIDDFADARCDLIVTIGAEMGEATAAAALQHPNVDFIGIDQHHGEDLPNLAGLVFPEDRAGFLVGALAASATVTGVVAVILDSGTEPSSVAYGTGFTNGVAHVDPDVEVLSIVHPGDREEPDADWGAAAAREALDGGADVVFGPGSRSGRGVLVEVAGTGFDARNGALCIGAEADDWLQVIKARRCLLTSVMKLPNEFHSMYFRPGQPPLIKHYEEALNLPAEYESERSYSTLTLINQEFRLGGTPSGGHVGPVGLHFFNRWGAHKTGVPNRTFGTSDDLESMLADLTGALWTGKVPTTTTTLAAKPSGFPRVCQTWEGIQNRPDLSEVERLASHDLVISTLHELELDWERSDDQPYTGLSTTLANTWEGDAVHRKASLLQLNPNFKFLASVYYREGPYVGDETNLTDLWDFGHFPPDSPFWFRDDGSEPVPAFGIDDNLDGVIQPAEIQLALVDFRNPDLIELIAQKALALDQSGVVDGIFLDWWSEHSVTAASFIDWSTFYMTLDEEVEARLAILRRIRELVSDDFLILGNTNQWTAPRSSLYMNGMFMESVKADWFSGYTVEELQIMEESLYWGSENLREPRINCLEGWRVVYNYGEPDHDAQIAERDSPENTQWMRLITTLSLTHSDGHVVFGADPIEAHEHNWYDFWDADLGQPVGPKRTTHGGVDGLFIREFTNGYAVYNRSGTEREVHLPDRYTAVSTGQVGEVHRIADMDGEILLR